MNAEAFAPGAGKQDSLLSALPLLQPVLQDSGRCPGERRAAFLPPLANDAQMGARAKEQIIPRKARDLRQSQSGLDRYQHKRVIASTSPGGLVRRSQQGVDLRAGKKADKGSGESLAGNCEHALNLGGLLGRLEGRVAKEGMDRREAQVAAADTDTLVVLKVIKEGNDQRRVDFLEVQARRWLVQCPFGELQ
jgi:hypothetical protein